MGLLAIRSLSVHQLLLGHGSPYPEDLQDPGFASSWSIMVLHPQG